MNAMARSWGRFLSLVVALLACITADAFAANGYTSAISVSQGAVGNSVVTLKGLGPNCSGTFASSYSGRGGAVSIVTATTGQCSGDSNPTPYLFSVDLGVLPVGHYVVAWSFDPDIGTPGANTTFDIQPPNPVAVTPICYGAGGCFRTEPPSPLSSQSTVADFGISSSALPDCAYVKNPAIAVAGSVVHVSGTYFPRPDCISLGKPNQLFQVVVPPLAAGEYTIEVTLAPDASYPNPPAINTLNGYIIGKSISTGTFTVTDDGPPVVDGNHGGLWWAAPAGIESGWGINFAHQGNTIFATWFTYDQSGKGMWVVMPAPQSGNATFSGLLYTTTGPAFSSVPFQPSKVTETVVGNASITFVDSENALFTYTLNGIQQQKPITRQVFGQLPTCGPAVNGFASATNYQDIWWAAPSGVESGWGINLTHQSDTIFATWFTYQTDGAQMWLVISASKVAAGTYTGNVYRTTGPPFNAVPFNPSSVVETVVGTATFAFSDGNDGTFSYSIYGVSQTKAITREVFSMPGTLCQ